jgi:hypothetical protein
LDGGFLSLGTQVDQLKNAGGVVMMPPVLREQPDVINEV